MKSSRLTDVTGVFIFSVLILLGKSQVNGVPLDFLNDLFGGGESTDESAGASADLSAGAAGSAALSVDKDTLLGNKEFDASIAGAKSINLHKGINKGKDVVLLFPPGTTSTPPPPYYQPPPYGYPEPRPSPPYEHPQPNPHYQYPPPRPMPVPIRGEPYEEHGIPLPIGRGPYNHPNPPPNYRNAPRPRPVGHGY